MPILAKLPRMHPVHWVLGEPPVTQAKVHTGKLCATVENLLTEDVVAQEQTRRSDACADGWNAVHAALGSFADEHCTL